MARVISAPGSRERGLESRYARPLLGNLGGVRFWERNGKALKLTVEIVRRPGDLHTFQVLPRRRVAGRTLARITRCRRTVRDYERLTRHHETIVYWAMIITMSRRLARNPRPGHGLRPRPPARMPGLASSVPGMTDAHDVVAAYWAAAEARDWDTFGALLAGDVIYRGPQTREQVRGRDAYIRFNVEGFAYDWHITVQEIIGEGHHAASWIEFTGQQGTQPGLCFFDLADDGTITRITDFWPDPYELPASRAHLVERY